jgi:glutamine synthetase
VLEAEKRGLLNIPSTNEALSHLTDEKNVALFEKHHVFTRQELVSRREILLSEYSKILNIEGQTLAEMVRREILPAVIRYTSELSDGVLKKSQLELCPDPELSLLRRLTDLAKRLSEENTALENELLEAKSLQDTAQAVADRYRNTIYVRMKSVREIIDAIEPDIAASAWPYPTYTDILFYCD